MIEIGKNITEYLRENFGDEYMSRFVEFYDSEPKTHIRISPRSDKQKLFEALTHYGIELKGVQGIPNAYEVTRGVDMVGKTIDYILGAYYIQSLSSMLPALVLNPSPKDKTLDLCAAPGSKTTQLSELMSNRGTLVSNDISIDRLRVLMYNIDKMNVVNAGVLNKKGELLCGFFDEYFDRILVDAPCSALGIIQKKGEVSNWWNRNKVSGIAEIQYKLLVSGIRMLKVGGELVYSTCTLTLEENELVLNKILEKYPVELVDVELPVESREAFTDIRGVKLNPGISKAKRIVPWEAGSEGFFVAKLVKSDKTDKRNADKSRFKNDIKLLNANSRDIKNYLSEISDYYGIEKSVFDDYRFIQRSKDIYFVDGRWDSIHTGLFNRIGSKFGAVDKKNRVQLHMLAAQILGKYVAKNRAELKNKSELEIYFRGGVIRRPFDSKGQKIVFYDDKILGTAVASDEGLKSQFPRAFRTQEIVIP
ncbi:RNA methylase [Melioribacter roseus P3M-2]|uniref:RNA methylase n=1 Tax=Melioribacter roseus (strain DSM 23840 / JCM 17771 / VKM B-2668 / P3M-2) TaxID=1191523 RepID=I7A3Z9_MELRP|nr:RsmB/NOP family class I SAM-dependent RNA methyltransferase [Melioribacter roseus]AFN74626.1 RNA methylase [Melioribacter roseus P3M-2]